MLTTVDDVINALGGSTTLVTMGCAKSTQVISNWRANGCFPARTYVLMMRELAEFRCSAPYTLWSMMEPLHWDNDDEEDDQ